MPLLSLPQTSGHFGAATQVLKENLDVIKAGSIRWYGSSVKACRSFRNTNDASFFYEKNDIDKTPFAAGTLDALTNFMRMRHI